MARDIYRVITNIRLANISESNWNILISKNIFRRKNNIDHVPIRDVAAVQKSFVIYKALKHILLN